MKSILLIIFSFSLTYTTLAKKQLNEISSYNIQFQNELIRVEENITSFQWDKMPNSSEFQDGYYGWIQFYNTPNQEIQDDFNSRGLELIEYIPNKVYLFYFPKNTSVQYLKNHGARAIVPIKHQYKLSNELRQQSHNTNEDDQLLVMLKFHNFAHSIDVIEESGKHEVSITQIFKGQNVLELSIPISSIKSIAELPFVKWLEISLPEDTAYDNRGRGPALIGITSGSFADTSDSSFSLAEQVQGFAFSQICPDGTTFGSDAVEAAESYDIYILGEKFMEIAGNSITTSITVPIEDPTKEIWAAIVAKNETENWASRRTIAINNGGGFLNCILSTDIGISQILNDPNDFSTPCSETENIIISTIINNTGTDPQSDFEVSYQLNNEAIVTEMYEGTIMPGDQVNYDISTSMIIPGADEYTLIVATHLPEDQNQFNNESSLTFFAAFNGTSLDFAESFDANRLLPAGWSILNPDNVLTRVELNGVIGSDGNATTDGYLNNWDYNAAGQEDHLISEYFDLTGLSSTATLSFDLAKAQWNEALNDDSRVEISTDCGVNFTTIYDKDDLELSTLPNYNNTDAWQPLSAADWRTDEIDLSPYLDKSVQIKFININGWGNSTFIDNVRLSQNLVSTNETTLERLKLFTNPVSETLQVTLNSQTPADASIIISNNLGQVVSNGVWNRNSIKTIDVSSYSTCIYFVIVTSKGISETQKLIIE